MKMRFCPGYHIARTCDGNCDVCPHTIVRDIDEAVLRFAAAVAPSVGYPLPLLNSGRSNAPAGAEASEGGA
ncbi:MAG: hypothetical protein CHACPFDD_03153 [Phycisphaerae bacterium]|nr:hypothetical protein [Phycisphaerae bacterium]